MTNYLVSGDPLAPSSSDLIAQLDTLKVGAPVPKGWRVMSGNSEYSSIARVVMRYEVESD